MLKWLQDRQLGYKVNRQTIYEHLKRPKFTFRGIIGNHEAEGYCETECIKWTSDGQFLVSLGQETEDDEDFFNKVTIWENPNTFSKRRIKSKIDLKQSGVHSEACFTTMQCHNEHVVVGGYWEGDDNDEDDDGDDEGVIHFISLSTGKLEKTIKIAEETFCIEFLSDNVLVGLSGHETIFNLDIRMDSSQIDYNHIKKYEKYGKNHKVDPLFHSLSCNKINTNEFVVGTFYGGLIFDVRQMKEPCCTFSHGILPTRRLRGSSGVPRPCQVSWSPTGRYIYTLVVGNDYINGHHMDNVCFFWDVQKSECIEMSIDPKSIISGDPQTWIGDNVTLVSSGNIVTTTPHSKTIENIIDFGPTSNGNVTHPSFKGLEYNDKTLQLAGANDDNSIFVWSHYKLPPYSNSILDHSSVGDSTSE